MVPSSSDTGLTKSHRGHTPFWLGALRAGFRAFLEQVHFERVSGPPRKRILVWDNELPDDSDSKAQNAAVATLSDNVRPLLLPWMPKKPVVSELAVIAGLAQAVETREHLCAILAPGQLTHLILPFLEEELSEAREAVEMSLERWLGWLGSEAATLGDPKVLFCNEAAETGSRISTQLKSLTGRVEKHLRAGDAVLLITPGLALTPGLQRLVGATLRAPSLSQAVLVEILRVLHTGAAVMADEDLRASLPSDQALRQVTPTQLQAALRLRERGQLFARLQVLATPPQPGGRVTLDAVRGQPEAVGHLRRMLADLRLWQTGKLDWSTATMSAALYGPPGNGKTMLAAAFAGSAGVPLFATSYSVCQKAGHQGDMLRALHEVFRQAEAAVPSVLFIDEIDGFSNRSRETQHDQYLRGVVNGLLTELSRAAGVPGLVLLAATNDLGVVDPAVIRPGRFDLKIPVLNPDRAGIRDILADHLTQADSPSLNDADLDAISTELVGSSGAAAAALAREAMSRARAEGRAVSPKDLFAVVRKGGTGASSDYLRRLAVHEAGHVIVRALSNLPAPQSVRVGAGVAAVQNPGLPFLTPDSAEEMLRDLLAGRAAERIILGTISSGAGEGASSDLAQATALAAKMETEWGFSEGAPVWQSAATLMLFNLPNSTRAAIEQRLMAAEIAAEDLLRQHQDALMRLVDILLERRELVGLDLLGVLSDLGLSADRDALVSAPVG
jgi:cell division protease FtsH